MAVNFITFDKDKYHLHLIMEQWCRDNIGRGEWTSWKDAPWPGDSTKWVIHSMFGRTTFLFLESVDLTAFKLRWAGP